MSITNCMRCGAQCRVNPKPGSNARMLKRGSQPKGLCVNCAVHDWMRNTYPVNLMIMTLNPEMLRLEHIQNEFTGIMKAGGADALPDEINWEAIIANWDLPFPNKVKGSAMNPASQAVLDMEPENQARQENYFREEMTAQDEGFGSLLEKHQAEQDRIIQEEFLPLMRRRDNEEDEDIL